MDADVTALLVDALHDTLGDMVWGSKYGQIYGLLNKKEENGKAVAVSVDVNFGGGGGANYDKAKTNSSLVKRVQFLVPFFKGYGISTVPLDDNNLTKGPQSAAVLLVDESQKAIDMAKNGMDVYLCSDGYGTRGIIQTATSLGGGVWTIKFTTQSSCRRFWPQMVITQKDTPSGTLQAGNAIVTDVYVATRTIKVTVTGMTPTNGYAVGQEGDQASGSDFTVNPGLPAWIPPAAQRPVSGSFMGVSRSTYEQRLAGSYLDGTKMSVLEGILQLDAQIGNVPGAMPDTIICSTTTKAKIISDCQTQKRYMETVEVSSRGLTNGKGEAITVFFKVVQVQGNSGMLMILDSANWDDDLVFVGTSDDLYCASPGNMPIRPINSNGSPIVEDPNQDACLVRFRSQCAVYPNNPGFHGMLTTRTTVS